MLPCMAISMPHEKTMHTSCHLQLNYVISSGQIALERDAVNLLCKELASRKLLQQLLLTMLQNHCDHSH